MKKIYLCLLLVCTSSLSFAESYLGLNIDLPSNSVVAFKYFEDPTQSAKLMWNIEKLSSGGERYQQIISPKVTNPIAKIPRVYSVHRQNGSSMIEAVTVNQGYMISKAVSMDAMIDCPKLAQTDTPARKCKAVTKNYCAKFKTEMQRMGLEMESLAKCTDLARTMGSLYKTEIPKMEKLKEVLAKDDPSVKDLKISEPGSDLWEVAIRCNSLSTWIGPDDLAGSATSSKAQPSAGKN